MENGSIVKEIQEFLKFTIDYMTIFKVDADGYIRSKVNEEYVTLNVRKKNYKLQIFTDVVTNTKDTIILNPINESLTSSGNVENKWFYMSLALGLNYKIRSIIDHICYYNSIDEDQVLTAELIDFISKYSEYVDDKFKEEFKRINKDPFEFVNVYYSSKRRKAIFRSSVFEDTLDKLKIRKRTKQCIKNMIMDILGVEKEEEVEKFQVEAATLKCPTLEATLKVYEKIYTNMNRIVDILNIDDEYMKVDVDRLSKYIDRLETYYDKTKWLVQTTNKESKQHVKPKTESSFSPVPQPQTQPTPKTTNKIGNIPIITEKPIAINNHMFFTQPSMFTQQPMFNQPMQNLYQQQPMNMFSTPLIGGSGPIKL